jgi:CHAD domain-containing protein
MAIADERIRTIFKKVERDLSNLASGRQAENVHSFRTSTRRLQTLLEELAADRNRNQKKLLKLLDGVRRRAGKVRNVDVQLSALRKVLIKEHIREIEKRLHRAADEVTNKTEKGKVEPEGKRDPLLVAKEILARAMPSKAGSMTNESSLHERRILIKRARYVAEFAPKSSEATQLISQLQRLQDALGSWHDWQSLTNTAEKRLGDVRQSSLVAALHNTTDGKLRNAMAALAASGAEQAPKPSMLPPRPRKAMVKPSTSSEQAESAA